MKRQLGLLYRVGFPAPEEVVPKDGNEFSLKELQDFVGGYIEHVPGSHPPAYCNEDGRLLKLPLNEVASIVFSRALVGDVIHIQNRRA